ncbi:hypothetical protein GF369_03585 [Candidatus Peregrinibacteria bacterium]|nr:hypothetical protein [Candidatus Peregrinibacteria bacterium]
MSDDTTINLYDMRKEQFDRECDNIQTKTEALLHMVPKHDRERRKKILDLHKLKLKKALQKLNNDLKTL